jgi:CubicO group peptidase (beta-lactamase class C family)
VRTEDIARFGQLYLQQGEWLGQRLMSSRWIETATAHQTSNGSNPNSDWEQGYGYPKNSGWTRERIYSSATTH